ncbi:hypothetical protein BVG80_13350 [Sphingobacteriales bacterium TSM_CSM]|nr:hypothetical protein BVG80_13350 [Sphingobacteriales bacterium TSM_CSM]
MQQFLHTGYNLQQNKVVLITCFLWGMKGAGLPKQVYLLLCRLQLLALTNVVKKQTLPLKASVF